MKKKFSLLILTLSLTLNSCYFGAGEIEVNLPGNYFLFGNNSVEETAIWFNTGEHSSDIIIKETVFAVGYNKDFIIAKSFPKDSLKPLKDNFVHYHILAVNEKSPQKSSGMNFKEYKLKRDKLNLPYDLNFTIVFHEVAKN